MPAGLILITGSAGRVGQAVVAELNRRGLRVRGFDRRPTPGLADAVVGEITDAEALRRAVEGAEVIIHLAATPDDDDFLNQLLPNNIVGPYHLLEAALQAGVGRLILASSAQVVWHQRGSGPWPIRVDTQPTPRYWYAATKVFLEAAGRAYAETHGISVLAVRLGWCPRTPVQEQEIAANDWAQDTYLSPGDAGRFFAAALERTDPPRFAVVYATSIPKRMERLDLEPAKRLLGYEPEDTWPQGSEVAKGSGA